MLVLRRSFLYKQYINKSNVFYTLKRYHMHDKIFYNNSSEFNKPIIIEYTPQNINVEYLVWCCGKECKKCKFSNKYDENAKDCCGNNCEYCPDKK